MALFFKILILIHFAWHAVASLLVAAAIWHSYEAHSHSKWKLVAAVLWLLVSVALMFAPDNACT